MRIIKSAGFPYQNRGNYIHAEEQADIIFVSQELIQSVREYFIKKDIAEFERFVVLHHDHTAVYASSDPESKR